MTAHAKLSASGAHRWMNCPASISMEEGVPDRGSTFAAEGTAAHEVAENCLSLGLNACDMSGEEIVVEDQVFVVDDEMVEAVQLYVDYVRDQKGDLLVEKRVDFSPWVPGGFGTADAIVLDNNVATVIDLKYGRGVKVDAEENPQAMAYALGALYGYDFLFDCETFKLVIVQPRLDHISEWEISRDDLMVWAEDKLKPAADLALSDNPPFQPGDSQCRFCKAKATCRALADHAHAVVMDGFGGSVKDPAKLSNEEVAELLPEVDLVTGWAKSLEAYALQQLETGQDVPGYKLVAGRSTRKWRDEAEAEAALRKKLKVGECFSKKLITPPAAEKLLGKGHAILADHVTKPEGKPALAPISDKRPALEIDPSQGFDKVA